MVENYKHLYHQTKIMLEKYQDEIVPGFREQLEKRVEVVRCKDCIHWSRTYEDYDCCMKKRYVYCDSQYCTTENDYCSLGERKDDATD